MTTVRTLTILNNPVFLNPQAYYVFPQLYNITSSSESVSHSIEKAVYSGRLSVIVDSGNIDYLINPDSIEFTANGNCVFTIIQNNDQGSCVLGRWNIYHTAVPKIIPVARYSAKGRTNQDANRTMLPDLTGNGHDIVLKNFSYSLMSGFGGYSDSFIRFSDQVDRATIINKSNSSFTVIATKIDKFPFLYTRTTEALRETNSMKIKITGLTKDAPEIKYSYVEIVNGAPKRKDFDFSNGDGEYTLPKSEAVTTVEQTFGWNGFYVNVIASNLNIVVEQIPLYPDGLVSDGIDDYGECLNMPIFTDYTVICKRKHLDISDIPSKSFISKYNKIGNDLAIGAFVIEFIEKGYKVGSFRQASSLDKFSDDTVIWQTKNSYCNIPIVPGTSIDTDKFYLFRLSTLIPGYFMSSVIYDLIIYDRTLTEEEIQKEIKKYNL